MSSIGPTIRNLHTWLAWLLLSLSCSQGLWAQAAGMTASELFNAANQAYSAGDFARAAQLFQQFDQDFGQSQEATSVMERVVALWAFALIRQGSFEPAVPVIERYLKEFPNEKSSNDLFFWLGFAQLRAGEPARAFATLQSFAEKLPQHPRLHEVRMSQAIALMQQEKWKELAEFLAPLEESLPDKLAARASMMRLLALFRSDQFDTCLERIQALDTRQDRFDSIVVYHLVALQTGAALMEQGRHRDALIALQRVWNRNRIIGRQERRAEKLRAELACLERTKGDPLQMADLRDTLAQISRELDQLAKIPDYETARGFRVAACFFELERFRESFLMLREMVKIQPESELLTRANYQMLIALTRMERWTEAIESGQAFLTKYSSHPLVPHVLYLTGESQMRLKSFAEASRTFARLAKEFPKFQEAARAHFLSGYCLLMIEDYAQARKVLEQHPRLFPGSAFMEVAGYWSTMALHFQKQYAASREEFGEYLRKNPRGRFADEAAFRRAQSLFNMSEFITAFRELEQFLKDFPQSARRDEALNLLGDSLFAIGEISRGLQAYAQVSQAEPRLYEYAYFRRGQALKAQELFDEMEAHYRAFVENHPKSGRISEALHHIAWCRRRAGDVEAARQIYWQTITQHGDDPDARAVEDMLLGMRKLYRSPEDRDLLFVKLSDLAEEAAGAKRAVLHARALWARGMLDQRNHPEASQETLLRATQVADPRQLSPRLLADFGDVLRKAGQNARAAEFYDTLIKWHPRSMEKDRAYAGMGMLAMAEGKEKAALDWFDRFDREVRDSSQRAEVLSARADLLVKRRQYDEAIAALEAILEIPSAKGLPWVHALLRMGDIRMSQNDPKRAIPYYQRVYVLYGRFTNEVAHAYWRSAQAFESLGMAAEHQATLAEFLQNTHLSATPEYEKALAAMKQINPNYEVPVHDSAVQ